MTNNNMPSILVIDDEPDMLHMLQTLLESAFPSVEILAAGGVLVGLELLEARRPLLAVVDFRMPRLDGLEFAKKVDERGLDIPIIILTAFADSALEAKVRAAPHVHAFFHKPLDPPRLVEEIERILEKREAASNGKARAGRPSKVKRSAGRTA